MLQGVLDNRYEILERIGGGGMADVYKAHDKILDRVVAVKILHAQLAGDTAVICYEEGGVPMGNAPQLEGSGDISLFIGSEGGFERSEVELILNSGGCAVTLGKRILRAETAPLAALSVIMYLTGNLS